METKEIYVKIIMVAHYFLKNASCLSLEALKDFDPTVDQIAHDIRILTAILKEIAVEDSCEDESMAINALQCCNIMKRVATAVANNDDKALKDAFTDLETHTSVP